MRLNILLILILFSCSLAAQSGDDSHAIPEERFAQVRMLADSGDLFARELAKEILIVDPGYNDVSIYLARLYGRDTMYDSAMSIIDTVLNGNPNNADAHLARCDLLYWSNDWNALEGAASEGLEVIPDHPDLLYKRALALYHLGDPRASFEMVEKVLHNDSAHAAAKRLERLLYTERDHPELFVRYMFDYFNDPYLRRWRMISLGGSLPLAKGTVSPSLLAGHLDNDSVSFRASSAIQLNTDAYFDIGEMNYMLIGYGLGTGTYLPRHKALVQFWQTLPAGWSVNAGVRYFYFDQHYVFYAAGIVYVNHCFTDYFYQLFPSDRITFFRLFGCCYLDNRIFI